VSGPFKIVASRHFENAMVVRRSTKIGLIPHIPNPHVPVSVLLANSARLVGGSVVRNYQLKISVILRQDGFEGLTNESLTVVNRHADADQRFAGTSIALIGRWATLVGDLPRDWRRSLHVMLFRTRLRLLPNSREKLRNLLPASPGIYFESLF
jgi:hypothetical protein